MASQERRKFPRAPEAFAVQYRVYGDITASWHEVTTVNLSAGGLRFRGPDPLEPGTLLELTIRLSGFQQVLVFRGAVVWNQMQSPGVTECGVQFMDLTTPQQAQIDRLVLFLRQRF